MKRKCLFIILALVVVFGSVSVASAATNVGTRVNRTSNTSADVSAYISSTKTMDHCAAQIILQEKYNGSWRTATGVPVKSVSRSKVNFRTFNFPYTFTLVKGKIYRIKAVHVYSDSATTKTSVSYSTIF